jgi:hypothetical protein
VRRSMTDDDTPPTGTYIKVVVLEAAIVFALWLIGRMFS